MEHSRINESIMQNYSHYVLARHLHLEGLGHQQNPKNMYGGYYGSKNVVARARSNDTYLWTWIARITNWTLLTLFTLKKEDYTLESIMTPCWHCYREHRKCSTSSWKAIEKYFS